MWIGSQHPETPFVEIGQFATFFYFSWFLIIVPIIGLIENSMLGIISPLWRKTEITISNKQFFPLKIEIISFKNIKIETISFKNIIENIQFINTRIKIFILLNPNKVNFMMSAI
jgi:hypothetical protein